MVERTIEEKKAAYDARQEIAHEEALEEAKAALADYFTKAQAEIIAAAIDEYYERRQTEAWLIED